MKRVSRKFENGRLIEFTINGIPQPLGMGDKIERILKPIARLLGNCGGCNRMKERLNAGMPFTEALKLRLKGS